DRTDQEGLGRQEPAAPRLSRQLVEGVQQDVSRDSQDEHYLTYSVLPDLSDSYWPYRSTTIFLPEELEVCSSLEVTKNQFHHEEEEDQDQACPRFSRELPVVEEQDNPWDSLDECYMISSAFPDLSDPHGNSRRADINSFQNLDICSPLEAAQNHNDLLEEDQDWICPSPPCHTRFPRELPVAEGNEVPQDSLDECYLTSSVGHDLPDTWRPYTSASSIFDTLETFLGLDVD
uniref:Neuroblastoma breakpoint family member 3-like n=1 Tax=Callorhinus ursinus TaxID=34884 RepID=A0A3Q7NRX8_CALUR